MTILALLLLLPALFLWLFLSAGLFSMGKSDPAGNGLAQAYLIITLLLLWGFLALLLILAMIHGRPPTWIILGLILLTPATCLGAIGAFALLTDRQAPRWLRIVPIALPGLLLAEGACTWFLARGQTGSTPMAILILGIAALAIAAIPIPGWLLRQRRITAGRERWRRMQAELESPPPADTNPRA